MNEDQWIYGSAKTRLSYEEYFKTNILNVTEYKWIREFYDKPLNELRELIDSSGKDSKTYVRFAVFTPGIRMISFFICRSSHC